MLKSEQKLSKSFYLIRTINPHDWTYIIEHNINTDINLNIKNIKMLYILCKFYFDKFIKNYKIVDLVKFKHGLHLFSGTPKCADLIKKGKNLGGCSIIKYEHIYFCGIYNWRENKYEFYYNNAYQDSLFSLYFALGLEEIIQSNRL